MKRILISAGVFICVFALMCLAARLIIKTSAGVEDGVSDKTVFFPGSKKEKSEKADTAQSNAEKDASAGEDENASGQTGAADDAAGVTGQETAADISESAGNDEETPDSASGNDAADPEGNEGSSEATEGSDAAEPEPDDGAGSDHIPVICIDAAHQSKADISQEAIGPGASETKYKVTSGATGTTTGGPEYIVNLGIAMKLKEILTGRGYEVVMTRENADVNLSDSTRAKMANESADIVIHIHCNADDTRNTMSGIMAFEPSEENKYVPADVRSECARLGSCLLDRLADATGAKNWGVIRNDNLTALNWTKIPASHVEVGYLTNPDEDRMLQTDDYQQLIASALADGVDLFFTKE